MAAGLALPIEWELCWRSAVEADLTGLSRADALTELPNRHVFEETIERTFVEVRRHGGSVGLLVVDADHFKRYNDHRGCIPALARYDGQLWRTLRAADSEGWTAKVAFLSARYGFATQQPGSPTTIRA